jgi:hypothetical protein
MYRLQYYCKLYKQIERDGLLEKTQEMERISRKLENATGIRQNCGGLVENWNYGKMHLRESHLGKSYTSSSKTLEEIQAGNRLHESQQIYEAYPFQNGGNSDIKRSSVNKRVCYNLQPKGSIQSCTRSSFNEESSRYVLEKRCISLFRSAVRTVRCPPSFHKNNETYCKNNRGDMEYKSSYISRKHSNSSLRQRSSRTSRKRSDSLSPVVGIDRKSREITFKTTESITVLRMN